MASQTHLERVMGYIDVGRNSSARLVTGGGRGDFDRGWFVEPTVFADVDNNDQLATDEERAMGVARRIRTGTIGVNRYDIDLGAPFGGMKDSGIGRELGPEGIDNYLEFKSIYAPAGYLH